MIIASQKKKATGEKTSPAFLTLRELKGEEDWKALYPLIKQLNKDLKRKDYDAMLAQMLANGYRCVGAWKEGRLVGAIGFWVGVRFWCKKYFDLDNVVTDTKERSRGIGKKLLQWVEKEAKKLKCHIIGLDSYTTAYRAHGFYFREGYCILGYHFTKKL